MKKLLSIVLVITMIMSFASLNTFAIMTETDNVVFTQDFSNAVSKTDFDTASAGYASVDQTNKWLRVSANTNATATTIAQAGAKVFIDNANMEVGKAYKIYADVTFTPQSADAGTVTSRQVNMKVLNGTGADLVANTTYGATVNVGETVALSTKPFEYTEALKTNTVNFRIDFNAYRTSDTDKDVVTVDNVKVIEVEGESIFKKARSINFDLLEDGYTLDVYDYDKNNGGTPVITSEVAYGGSGNSLKMTPNAAGNRHTLKGFFDKDDLDKSFTFTMKVYPTKVSATGIRIGLKPYIPSSNSAWYSNTKFYTVGEAGSNCDMIVNQWNTITFNATIFEYTEGGVTYVSDSIAVAQYASGITSTELIDVFYIDDIVIEEYTSEERTSSYFKGMASNEAVTKSFEEDDLVLEKNLDFKDGSTGYGAISVSNKEARTGTKSIEIMGRTNITGRYKFLDVFAGAKKGDAYKVSAWVKVAGTNSEEGAIVTLAAMSNEYYADMFYGSAMANANDWTKIEFTYIVEEDTNGNLMDELAIAQEGLSSSVAAVGTIYVDDITVEPVTDDTIATVLSGQKNNITSFRVGVKFPNDSVAFENVSNPLMLVAICNTDGEIMKVDVVDYDANAANYAYYIDDLTHDLVGSVKLFKWNGDNLYPVAAAIDLK